MPMESGGVQDEREDSEAQGERVLKWTNTSSLLQSLLSLLCAKLKTEKKADNGSVTVEDKKKKEWNP